jgi:GTPase SAR1 family protein
MQFGGEPITIKILVVGNAQTGKSSFVNRYVKDKDSLMVS